MREGLDDGSQDVGRKSSGRRQIFANRGKAFTMVRPKLRLSSKQLAFAEQLEILGTEVSSLLGELVTR